MSVTIRQIDGATITVPTAGPELFSAFCASCHGADGKGNGPAAGALKTKLPDLTTLAKRKGGRFPEGDVYQVIKWGGGIVGHGSKEMPVWGTAFKPDTNPDDKAVDERIRTLTSYIGSLQAK
jgi:mono/diheme cytochrome c family protein